MSSRGPLILVAIVRLPVSPDSTGSIRRSTPQGTGCEYLDILKIPVSKWKEDVIDYLDFLLTLEKHLRLLWATDDILNDYPDKMTIGLYQVR
jgi:hypothetical protein